MSDGRVLFVGCGPGAPDLLTLRAVDALTAADVIVWSASLIERRTIAAHARAEAELVEWPPATQREIDALYDRALAAPLLLADAAALTDAPAAGSAIAVHGASRAPRVLQRDLLDRGLPGATPCAVAIEVSRRDELLAPCTLDELAETLEDLGRGRLTLVLAGPRNAA